MPDVASRPPPIATEPASGPYAGYEGWKRWDRLFAPTADERAYFAGETRGLVIAGGALLEIGFGSGSFLAWAREMGARVCGVEVIPALIEAARREGIELLPPDIERIADAHAGRFDTIVAFDVFEHFSLAEIFVRLDAAATLLKPGGHLVLRFPNAQSPFGLAPQHGDPTHKTALSRGVFEQIMQQRPFAIVRYAGSHRIGGGPWRQRIGRAVRRRLQDALGGALNAIWSQDIPWAPVVVLVLRKSG